MPVMGPSHDLAHPVGVDPAWSESYYFNAYAPAADVGFFARVGIRPNAGTMDGFVWAWLPDGRAGRLHELAACDSMVDSVLEVGGIRFEMVEPMRRWRLRAHGDVGEGHHLAFDATFDALMPAIGVDRTAASAGDEAIAAARASLATGHLEQAGAWTGSVTVGDDTFSLDGARGNRDKSWGPRRADGGGGMTAWRWFSVNIGDDTHLGGVRISTNAGDVHRGWIWTDGAASSIRDWAITTRAASDAVRHESLDVVVSDKRGREYRLHGDVLRAEALGEGDRARLLVYEGLTRWELDGDVGYGISEYAHVLDDDGRPLAPVT